MIRAVEGWTCFCNIFGRREVTSMIGQTRDTNREHASNACAASHRPTRYDYSSSRQSDNANLTSRCWTVLRKTKMVLSYKTMFSKKLFKHFWIHDKIKFNGIFKIIKILYLKKQKSWIIFATGDEITWSVAEGPEVVYLHVPWTITCARAQVHIQIYGWWWCPGAAMCEVPYCRGKWKTWFFRCRIVYWLLYCPLSLTCRGS